MALVQEPLSQAGVMKTVLVYPPLVIKNCIILYYKLSLSNLRKNYLTVTWLR